MKTTAYRKTDKLTPQFKEKVEKFLAEVNKNGQIIFLTETWRTQERQNELLKLWLSQVKHSNHQDGLAFDIWFFGAELYPADLNKWRAVADIAKKYNIDWGYDLWKWDKPHFQDNGTPILALINPNMKKSKYSDIMNAVIKETNFDTIFDKHEGDGQITEQETKELIEIAFARFATRNNLK